MKLGDICSKIGSGATPRGGKDSYKDSGTAIIRSQNVLDWSFSSSGLAFIDDDQSKALSNAEVKQGDVLLNITGDSVARACMAPSEFLPARVNQHVAIIRANEEADNLFLLAWLQANKGTLLKLASSGATRNALTKRMLENLDVNLPPIDVQDKVAAFIDSIQAKIALNTKLNGYLEEILTIKFSDLISGGDCRYVPLSEIIHFQEGPGIRNWQYVYDGTGVDFINIRCIQNHDLNLADANQISVEEAYGKYSHFLVNSGDILMSTSGTLGRYAIARPEHLPLCMNTSVIRFKPLNDPAAYAFVYGYLTSREFYKHLLGMANGSAQVNFGPTHLKKIEIPWPGATKVHAFNETSMPLIDEMNCLHSESKKLAALRDTLLPKLITGEIDVSRVDITQLNSHLA